MESVRKDVEHFFGIPKGRFRILKLPTLIRRKYNADNVVFTRFILHTMLHSFDSLDEWERGIQWAGADGFHDELVANLRTDVSAVGTRKDMENDKPPELETEHDVLKKKRMTSFKRRKGRGEISWYQWKIA